MTAYYNEIDPYAAQWLRNLIAAGHIAAGDVDERSIRDVQPVDLIGYTQAHFFAGIGIWSAALRQAGWSDQRPVWTGSCPCQPFSAAGKRQGEADDRHLWPELYRLIAVCRPLVVFGEQVASKDGLAWLDTVQADLEASDYASGAIDLCSASVGAPHIRQRLYWMAHALRGGTGHAPRQGVGAQATAHGQNGSVPGQRLRPGLEGASSELADAEGQLGRLPIRSGSIQNSQPERGGQAGELADSDSSRCRTGWPGETSARPGSARLEPTGLRTAGELGDASEPRSLSGTSAGIHRGEESSGPRDAELERPGPANGFWFGADWIPCTDGKARPVESGTFPLAHGDPNRVGRLRAYGNAINQEAAVAFIEAAAAEIDGVSDVFG